MSNYKSRQKVKQYKMKQRQKLPVGEQINLIFKRYNKWERGMKKSGKWKPEWI
jgi:uncharacterized protein YggL (DUF469 family)